MVAVFLGFSTETDAVVKQLGFGMAVAIVLDATAVRMVLVPATMTMLGRWNWWLPAWLDRLLPTIEAETSAELWEELDDLESRRAPSTVSGGRSLGDGMHRFAGVLLVDRRGWVLLQERDEHPAIDPEKWSLCGGHLEDGEAYDTGASRELEEETGVRLGPDELTLFREIRIFHEAYGTHDTMQVFAALHRADRRRHRAGGGPPDRVRRPRRGRQARPVGLGAGDRPRLPRVRPLQEPARMELTRIPVPGPGAEDVVVGLRGRDEGAVFTGTEDGSVFRISHDGRRVDRVAHTGGRPLGIELDLDGRLLVCDAHRGLLRVDTADRRRRAGHRPRRTARRWCSATTRRSPPTGTSGSPTPRRSTDRAVEGRLRPGHPHRHGCSAWTPTARIEVVLDGLAFANGVALSRGRAYVAVAETRRAHRRTPLGGRRAGRASATSWSPTSPATPTTSRRAATG